MFNLVVRERIIDILSQKYGKQIEVQNSSLLRLYATMKAMCDTKIAQPDKAYEIVVARYSTLHYGYIPPKPISKYKSRTIFVLHKLRNDKAKGVLCTCRSRFAYAHRDCG